MDARGKAVTKIPVLDNLAISQVLGIGPTRRIGLFPAGLQHLADDIRPRSKFGKGIGTI